MLALLLRKLWFFLVLPRRNLHNRESPWNNPNASTSLPSPLPLFEGTKLSETSPPSSCADRPDNRTAIKANHPFSAPSRFPFALPVSIMRHGNHNFAFVGPSSSGSAVPTSGEQYPAITRSRTDQLDRWYTRVASQRRSISWNRCQRRLFSGSIFEGQVRAGCCYQRHMRSIARRSNAPIPIKGPLSPDRWNRLKPSLPKWLALLFCRVSMRVELNGELERGAVCRWRNGWCDARWLPSSKREGILRGKWGANDPMGPMARERKKEEKKEKEEGRRKRKKTRNVGCLDALVREN